MIENDGQGNLGTHNDVHGHVTYFLKRQFYYPYNTV